MDSLQQQLQQAQKAIVRGQLDYAGRILEKLRQTHTSTAKVWLLSAAWFQAVGDAPEALNALQQAATMGLAEPALRTQVIDAYISMQAWSQALRLLKQMDPDGNLFAVSMARCEWGMGDYQTAIKRLHSFVTTTPEHVEANVSLWQCLERFGQFSASDQQRQHCRNWAGTDPITTIMENTFLVADGQLTAAADLIQACQLRLSTAHAGLQRADRLIHQLQNSEQPAAIDVQAQGPTNKLNSARNQALDDAHQQSMSWLKSHGETPFFASSARLLMHALKTSTAIFTPSDWYLEFGVYYGRSLSVLASSELSQALHWHGFDSFSGLPEDWSEKETKGSYSTDGQVPEMPDNVTLHEGWFNDTLPPFIAQDKQASAAFIHIDCDLFSSTQTALEALRDRCRPGTVIQFDELIGYPGYQQHEWRAWQAFLQQWPQGYRLLGSVFMGRAVAVQLN